MSRLEKVAFYSVITVLPALTQAWKVSFSKFAFSEKTNLYIGSPDGSLVYITALGKTSRKPNHRQEQLRKNIFST